MSWGLRTRSGTASGSVHNQSHPSKLELIARAKAAGYLISLHVMLVPKELSVMRTKLRVQQGGHSVPEDRVRARYHRPWGLVTDAIRYVDEAVVYDNSLARKPFRVVARYRTAPPSSRPISLLGRRCVNPHLAFKPSLS